VMIEELKEETVAIVGDRERGLEIKRSSSS
jgi:hypothetical protein